MRLRFRARPTFELPLPAALLALGLAAAAPLAGPVSGPLATPFPAPLAAQQPARQAPEGAAPADPYLWLEEVEGERALAWAEARSDATLEALSSRPEFGPIRDEILAILTSEERIAFPSIRGGRLYNFWQDAEHPRGIYRRTTWEDYLAGDPAWETVLDIDALAAAEGVPWSYAGMTCLPPEERLCLVRLSRGGADAVEIREFDLERSAFVEDGFRLPEAKGGATWVDRNTLLVYTDFGEGSLTTSGYARIVKRWERGTSLEDAEVIFEAEADDMGVSSGSMETAENRFVVVTHRPAFFDRYLYLYEEGELRRVDVPTDSRAFPFRDRLILRLRSDWEVGGDTFRAGSVLSADLADYLAGGRDLEVVAAPTDRVTIRDVTPTRSHLVVETLEDVKGRLWRYTPSTDGWRRERIEAPDFGSVNVRASDVHEDRFFFTYSSFLQPTTLYLSEADGTVREVRRSPAMFDASGLTVSQHRAVSRDGTEVPYFLVHREGLERDGRNPTLLYGYGGFQISLTPGYDPTVGKAWLERGGTYAVANLRGGGEYGPDWWKAAQKEHRQRAYDDFLAVAEDLVARGITSPEHLGIQGGSNGGLLVGVAMTQRPDLFGAVVVDVPLLDMRRYHRLLAGASWMAEYGNPDTEDWSYIREYSPYHNVHPDRSYPRALFTTTTRDDRVHPGHARKMAKKMLDQGHPVLYYENTEGGHGSGVTPEQRARMLAVRYAYLHMMLGGEGSAREAPVRAPLSPEALTERYREVAGRLIGAALTDREGWEKLVHLTTRIGHRLSGSPQLEEAIRWAGEGMRAEGLEEVTLQPVRVPHWVRGHEEARIVAPVEREIAILGLGNSVGTPPGGIEAPVVVVGSFEELEALGREGVEGRIVLFAVPWEGYGRTVRYRISGASRAARLGAVAALVRSATGRSLYTPHTGTLRYDEDAPRIPAAAVTVEDAHWMRHMAGQGETVRVRLLMEARMLQDAESANVLAQITGSERPEEVVVMGGHFDSWDVGQGAHDDGAASVAAWHALTLVRRLGLRPRRTLRVVLWTNEENGGRGAAAYRDALGDGVHRHVAAIEMDGGMERPTGFGLTVRRPDATGGPGGGAGGGGREADGGTDPTQQEALIRLTAIGRLLAGIDAGRVTPGGGGADIAPLMREGVPGLAVRTVGEHYFDWHHTHADTLDKIDPENFRRAVAMLAVMGYVLADMPGRLAPPAGG